TLPGTTVDGVDVGGRSAEQLHERLEDLAARKSSARVFAVRDDDRVRGVAGNLGYAMDVEATAERVLYRGRQGNPITALRDQLRAFGNGIAIAPVESVDQAALDRWAQRAGDRLQLEPREGGLRFDGADIRRVDPRPGALVDTDDLAERAHGLLLAGAGGDIDVATEDVDPVTTDADVDEVYAQARQAVSAPVTLSRSGQDVTLSPEDIGAVLRTRVVEDDDQRIQLRVVPDRLTETIGSDRIAAFEQEPESARFEVGGGSVRIIDSSDGFSFDPRAAADQLLALATGDGSREATLEGQVEEPDLTTQQAEDLNVVEKVAEFTTNHDCCQSRVTNIHRIADLVDDTLIKPGETFSVNGHVGERTEAKGFVGGGAIFEGEFVEQIGGGVSQFATTLYNAAYFGGYEIVEHKAHSYYISRYPEGREATLNYPNVDLKIRNNSPHGLVIDTSYTDTSITVAVYGTTWVEVDSETGPRRNITRPTTQYRENDELPKGSQRVVQEAGSNGFDVTVTRILRFPDGETRREEVTTTYLAQPRIIERNT
ncbi:MAG TPA: VanW family protein, partial [Egibacteraceae bacterium]|nr:VanW family protein [Egibacteraceae bacterium]